MAREFPKIPMVGIGVVVIRDGQVLLIRRAKPPRRGEWSIPGGLQKLGETVFQAASREVMEEANIIIRPLSVIDVVDLIEWDKQRVRYHYTLIDIVAAFVDGEAVAGADAAEVLWANQAEMVKLVAWSETVRIIECAWRKYAIPQTEADA